METEGSLPSLQKLEPCPNLSYDYTVPNLISKSKTKLRGLSPRTNYTDRATAACTRSANVCG
jgi:hypothetical protein